MDNYLIKFTRIISIVPLVFVLSGCESKISGITQVATTTTATVSLVDVKRIVTTGSSLTFNQATGGINDLSINPVTGLPAIIYYDKSSNLTGGSAPGALKYAYMDSAGAWNIEVVDANYGTAACGAANSYCIGAPNVAGGATASIMRVAFKSDGTPAIAYVYGASLTTVGGSKQIRYAERVNGGWSISVPFSTPTAVAVTNGAIAATVDALKGVTLNFDSADRPHITFGFYAQTITNSKYKYAQRSTAGSWTNSDIMANVSGAGTITANAQGQNQNGAVMCPNNGMLVVATSLVDTAAGVGKPYFGRCTAVDSSTGACTTWSMLSLSNGCGTTQSCFGATITTATNAATRMDVAIDAATKRPIIGIYATATPALTLLTVTAPNACDVAQPTASASWTGTSAPVTVSAASAGANGFRLASSDSTTNTNALAYLLGTTAVHVNKSTGPAGAWLATGTIAETATVAGEGVGFGYNSTADQIYVSYASTPAVAAGAVGGDIKVASGQIGDVTLSGTAGTLLLNFIDSLGTVFPTAAVPMLSAAKAANGTVGYAYFYQDATVADSKLYYGVRGGTTTAPVFSDTFVTNFGEGAASPQFLGSYPSLTYDSNSNPIIAYYNGVTADQSLQVARSFNGGATFAITTVDELSANIGQYPSAASSGNTLGISYYDVTNTGLKFARWTSTHGWRRYLIDGLTGGACGVVGDDAGKYSVLRFTSTGRPVILYQANSNLKLAIGAEAPTSATYTWTCTTIDVAGNTRGEGIDFVLSSSDVPHIAHFDATAGQVRYVTCSSDIASCASTGSGAFTASIAGTSGITTSIVTKPGIQLNSNGTVFIAHYTDTNLGSMAYLSMASGASGFTTEYIDANTGGGSYTSLVGQYPVMLLNSSGYPMIFYRSSENWIRYFSREPQ